jgi:hypothetical protein
MKKIILILGIIGLFVGISINPSIAVLHSNNIEIDTLSVNPPKEEWNRTFGDSKKEKQDAGHDVQQTSDGGYIIAGTTKSQGDSRGDFWLIKTNKSGIEQWNETYGGIYGDFARSVLQTNDSGYIILGQTSSYGAGDYDCWLVKTDNFGNELWNKTYGGSGRESSKSVHITSDGGYLIVGWTRSFGNGNSDFWLVKTDANGIEEWNKTYGGLDREEAWDGQITSDGGFIVVGTTSNEYPYSQILLLKTDSNGITEWLKTYGDINSSIGANSLQETNDNGFIISGTVCSNFSCNLLLFKTDKDGVEQWNKTFEGEAFFDSICYSVHQTLDGGFIATGETEIIGDFYYSSLLVKTNINGDLQWYKTFNRTLHCRGLKVRQTNDRGFIIVGEIDFYGDVGGDVWLIKIAKENLPPTLPIIDGPTSGKPGIEYEYTFNSTDFNEDPVMYFVNWGDNDTEWTEYGDSGEEISLRHIWDNKGNYTIKAKAKDINGSESDWSEFTVIMPRDKAISSLPLLRFLERYPLLQELLMRLGLQ